MKYLLPAIVAILMALQCEAQLQVHPPGEDTMSNKEVAKWYADYYRKILGLSATQEKLVTKAIEKDRNLKDSLKKTSTKLTTEQLFVLYQHMDKQMKAILTDIQYYDYVRTGSIKEVRMRKDTIRSK